MLVKLVGLSGHQIDDAFEAGLMTNRRLDGDGPGRELLEAVEDSPEVGVLFLHLVDDHEAWKVACADLLPGQLGAHHNAAVRADNDGRPFRRTKRATDITDEVLKPRGVEQVDLVIAPGQMGDRRADRNLSLDLFRLEIEGGVTGVRLAQAVDGPAGIKHRLRQAGLAIVAVPEQGDIANLVGIESGHRFSPRRR